jgi:GxxExxY protein
MKTDQEQAKSYDGARPKGARFGGLHAEVTDVVLKVFYEVYNELCGGFLESVYHKAFAIALRQAGLAVSAEVRVPVYFRGVSVGDFVADLTVTGCVLLELKAVSALDRVHEGQILNYLRATDFEIGLLFNFGPKPQFKRFLLDNQQKTIRVHPCESVVESWEAAAK